VGYAHDYATAILHRGRIPMPPVDFVPDWSDAPRRSKLYPDAPAVPLPDELRRTDPDPSTMDDALAAAPADAPFTLESLGRLLRHSYGLLGRRLGIQANTDLAALPSYAHANWHRGTASGGGLYPCSVYWIAGPGAGPAPGVYHYHPSRHAMQRLLVGDVSGRIRTALGAATAETATQFLVVGVKYWQNAFKYNNFSYHAVTMDVGTILSTWLLWSRAHGQRIAPAFWFDQAALTDLLGLDPAAEGLFAVVPLRWAGAATGAAAGATASTAAFTATGAAAGAAPAVAEAPVRVRRADRERSRTVLRFEALQRIHASTATVAADRPPVGALAGAGALPAPPGGERLPLPPPAPMPMRLTGVLRRRRSSFGRFDASHPISAAQFGASLVASAAATLPTEIDGPGDGPLTKLYAFVNHVTGVPAGSYEYLPERHELRRVRAEPPGYFLQRNYFLANYNLEQAAAVLVPCIRTHAVLDAVGERGYNLVNATIGAVAQNFYLSAAALDLGAGVALGFDNISYIEHLGIDATGEAPLLVMMLGNERANPGDYRYELG
jgi:SagB-type dehydrogenase family enzyme